MKRKLIAIMILFALTSVATAQNEGCPSAVEYGKGMMNDCIESGGAACRTPEAVDNAWALAISTQYVKSQGGCAMTNRLYQINLPGLPVPPNRAPIALPVPPTVSHPSPTPPTPPAFDAPELTPAQQTQLDVAKDAAQSNPAVNPFGGATSNAGGANGSKATPSGPANKQGTSCITTDLHGLECVKGCFQKTHNGRVVFYCSNDCDERLQVNYLFTDSTGVTEQRWGVVPPGTNKRVEDYAAPANFQALGGQCLGDSTNKY